MLGGYTSQIQFVLLLLSGKKNKKIAIITAAKEFQPLSLIRNKLYVRTVLVALSRLTLLIKNTGQIGKQVEY